MFFWNSLVFFYDTVDVGYWSLVPLPFLNPACTSGSSQFTYCWNLDWNILGITFVAWGMSETVQQFLVSSASVRSLPFLSFFVPIFAWNVPLECLVFLKRSLVFPILLFSSISSRHFLKKAFLSLLAILWNFAFSWVCLSLSALPFISLLYSAISICKASICLTAFLFLWDGFVTASCTMSWTSIHSSSGTLSTRSNLLNLLITSTV